MGKPVRDLFIGLGSNVGDRVDHLIYAARQIATRIASGEQTQLSSLYETVPVGMGDQPLFLNAVVRCTSAIEPRELLQELQNVERERGRDRALEVRFGPRPLDLDVLLLGTAVLCHEELCVPHPRMTERGFVLIPLLELSPELQCPRRGTAYRQDLAQLEDQGVRRFRSDRWLAAAEACSGSEAGWRRENGER